jgi:hypothetical protein
MYKFEVTAYEHAYLHNTFVKEHQLFVCLRGDLYYEEGYGWKTDWMDDKGNVIPRDAYASLFDK